MTQTFKALKQITRRANSLLILVLAFQFLRTSDDFSVFCRYLAIVRPFQARPLIGLTGTRVSIVTVFISSVVFNLLRFFEWQLDSIPCQDETSTYYRMSGFMQHPDHSLKKQVGFGFQSRLDAARSDSCCPPPPYMISGQLWKFYQNLSQFFFFFFCSIFFHLNFFHFCCIWHFWMFTPGCGYKARHCYQAFQFQSCEVSTDPGSFKGLNTNQRSIGRSANQILFDLEKMFGLVSVPTKPVTLGRKGGSLGSKWGWRVVGKICDTICVSLFQMHT